jgi:hypothetical protein
MWSVAEIAEALGWDTQRTRRWLLAGNGCTRFGRYFYANRSQMARVFGPEATPDIIAQLPGSMSA